MKPFPNNRTVLFQSQQLATLPPVINDAQRYLDAHFTESISIAEVASRFFYTREHLSRLFRRYLNITITEYLAYRRISYSCQLMKSDATLADICYQSGFNSLSTFIRTFKQVTGVTPSVYRKNLN